MEGFLDKPLNPNKLLKEQFVSNLSGSSLLEIAALSTIVPAVVVLRKWSSGDNIRSDLVKKNDDALRGHKYWVYYFSVLAVDYITVVLPILLFFTALAEWTYICAIFLVIVISIYIMFKRSQCHLKSRQHNLPSLRTDVSSYRVSVVLVTCLSILAVDFKIFPRRYAKAETYGCGIMDLGVGSFVVANALVSRQARNITSMKWKSALKSISPLVFLGFARLISTSGVDYQVHVGEYGVHWNFFFTLAAISILTSIIRIHPKYCGIVGMLVLAGYQVWLNVGLNEYLISNERSADIISQNKEGVYSIFGKKYFCAHGFFVISLLKAVRNIDHFKFVFLLVGRNTIADTGVMLGLPAHDYNQTNNLRNEKPQNKNIRSLNYSQLITRIKIAIHNTATKNRTDIYTR